MTEKPIKSKTPLHCEKRPCDFVIGKPIITSFQLQLTKLYNNTDS